MRPVVNYTQPHDGYQGFSPASPATVIFACALDTSILTQNVSIWNLSNNTACSPFTLTYTYADYALGISFPWEAATDYSIRIGRGMRASVQGTVAGVEFQFLFRTAGTIIGQPFLLSPSDQVRLTTLDGFSWITPSLATLHDIEVSRSPHFEYVDFATTVATLGGATLSVVPNNLESEYTYYWRARGIGGNWSPIRTFFYGQEPLGTQHLAPYEIVRIRPSDLSIQSSVAAVTIELTASPATPSATDAYWRVSSVMGETGFENAVWYGDWSIVGSSLVWTPAEPTLMTNAKYELYLDTVYDTTGRLLNIPVPEGAAVFAMTGPFTPLLAAPTEIQWAPNAPIAGYYLQLASETTLGMAAASIATSLLRQHAVLGARIRYTQDMIDGWLPDVGRSTKLGDYSKEVVPQAVDAWLKLLDQMQGRYNDLTEDISSSTGVYTGRRGINWDPATNDLDWFSSYQRQGDLTDSVSRGLFNPRTSRNS